MKCFSWSTNKKKLYVRFSSTDVSFQENFLGKTIFFSQPNQTALGKIAFLEVNNETRVLHQTVWEVFFHRKFIFLFIMCFFLLWTESCCLYIDFTITTCLILNSMIVEFGYFLDCMLWWGSGKVILGHNLRFEKLFYRE